MEVTTYERPREKLRNYGAGHLTDVELLQIVIGSGTSKASGARLAKRVGSLISTNQLTFDSLIKTKGIGFAKACQVLAAVELGQRVQSFEVKKTGEASRQKDLILRCRQHRINTLTCYWFDGGGFEIDSKKYSINKKEYSYTLVKQVFTDILATSARSVFVVVTVKDTNIKPDAYYLGLIGGIKDTAKLLSVTIDGIHAVSSDGLADWGVET